MSSFLSFFLSFFFFDWHWCGALSLCGFPLSLETDSHCGRFSGRLLHTWEALIQPDMLVSTALTGSVVTCLERVPAWAPVRVEAGSGMLWLPPGTLWETQEGCVKENGEPDALDGKRMSGWTKLLCCGLHGDSGELLHICRQQVLIRRGSWMITWSSRSSFSLMKAGSWHSFISVNEFF